MACGLVAAAPWGFWTVASVWFPWDSPLLHSGVVTVVPAVVLLGFLCSGGPLDVYGLDLLCICPGSRGVGLWLLTLTIAYFYGESLYAHVDSGVNRYTNVLY
ncbi:hypothetical protein ILYODFUR_038909 [Ilyodon furcidens]|uniref:Uncharacterized protein n=1 Tax=Ilyodon furcidens TaxID=33524 RepID=A0ABV0SSU0_9TELE